MRLCSVYRDHYYIWLRFQHVSFGIAAVVALVHDVPVFAAIAISKYLAGFLMIEDFKISSPVIAAFLTIIGYSLNDTLLCLTVSVKFEVES